jgi:O-acetyl-ADP-ribose deacetylase (regulator of RNase III)
VVIELYQGDITRLEVDAIVNAANPRLLGGGGVDGAIHRAAGPALARYCATLGGCPTGEARISPGFGLPAHWVVHTVGPVWHGGQQGEAAALAACYRSCFELALVRGIHSLAFPAISTGVYGFPKHAAAVIATAAMHQFESSFERIVACCFSGQDLQLYHSLLHGSA